MADWTISADGLDPVPARQLAAHAYPPLTRQASRHRTYLLTGSAQPQIAACAQTALRAGHRIVLLPGTPGNPVSAPGGTLLSAAGQTASAIPVTGTATRDGWDVATRDGKPVIELSGPATGIPLDPGEALPAGGLRTTDLGASDGHGRLRLLGRTDDEQISGLWPRDTLDALGPLLGRRCALVRHQHGRATVRLLTAVTPATATAMRARAADLLGITPEDVTITVHGTAPLLHSAKITRHPAASEMLP
jgi:hypothetical protein